jgi:hypothetical protein
VRPKNIFRIKFKQVATNENIALLTQTSFEYAGSYKNSVFGILFEMLKHLLMKGVLGLMKI